MHFNITKVDNEKQLKYLYDGSALTFEGVRTRQSDFEDMYNMFKESGVEFVDDYDIQVYVITGEFMNKSYGLTGDNAYPEDLHIVSIDLDQFKNQNALMAMRLQYFGLFRWFDDIVDNNNRRERSKRR